jgi:hypothetical protein
VPVDLGVSRPSVAGRAIERAGDCLTSRSGEAALQLVDDAAHDESRRVARAVRDDALEGDERRHEMHVGFDRLEHFRLEQHPLQVEPLERVLLHNANDGRREIGADVTQPSGH